MGQTMDKAKNVFTGYQADTTRDHCGAVHNARWESSMNIIEKVQNELLVQKAHQRNLSREENRLALRIQSLIQSQAELQLKIDVNERILEEEKRQADPKKWFERGFWR